MSNQDPLQAIKQVRKYIWMALVVVGIVVLAFAQGNDSATLRITQQKNKELAEVREAYAATLYELNETRQELVRERFAHAETNDLLETVRKQSRTVTREVYSPTGQIQERTVDVQTRDVVTRRKQRETITTAESAKVLEMTRASTESAVIAASESITIVTHEVNDTRTGFGIGYVMSLNGHPSVALSWQAWKVGPVDVEVLAGTSLSSPLTAPLMGIGAGVEVLPRFSVGAVAIAYPLQLTVTPGLTLQHRF